MILFCNYCLYYKTVQSNKRQDAALAVEACVPHEVAQDEGLTNHFWSSSVKTKPTERQVAGDKSIPCL